MAFFVSLLVTCNIGEVVAELPKNFHRGVSFAHVHSNEGGYGSPTSLQQLAYLKKLGVTHISLMPFGYQKSIHSPRIVGYEGRDSEGREIIRFDKTLSNDKLIKAIGNVHAMGMSVMMKPHIWSREFWTHTNDPKWRGDIVMRSAEDWKRWEKEFEAFTLHYARICEQHKVESFTFGLEYREVVRQRPLFFMGLIKKIRKVYKGQIGYQANWDDYHEVLFWNMLDYIGIGAYFPLGSNVEASAGDMISAWDGVLIRLIAFSQRFQKPIIFTEVGYQSCKGAHLGHSNPVKPHVSDLDVQVDAFTALFTMLQNQQIIKGIYIWKYMSAAKSYERDQAKIDFFPQGKPVETVIREHFK